MVFIKNPKAEQMEKDLNITYAEACVILERRKVKREALKRVSK